MIQEEIVKQKVTIDRSEELKNVLKLAIIAFTEQNFDKVKELADKALEIDVNCLDAMYMKVAVAKANGGNYQTLMELSEHCTNNLGLFTQEDIVKYLGSHISLKFVPNNKKVGALFIDIVVDNTRNFRLKAHCPVDFYIPNGKHIIQAKIFTGEFTVNGDSGFTIDDVWVGHVAKVLIKPCPLETAEAIAEREANRPSPIKIHMPKEYIHKEGKFDHFEFRSRAVKLGAIETMILSPGPQTMTFVEVTKKGLIGTNKHEYQLQFDVEKDASYTISIEDSNYVIKKD
ncbi:hypothetical protein AR505_0324 [methanogenic archaeon ISO4-H5]|nr:hypothetical protein AR505_0324 [methanogenic archaeon ISO4-H5]